MGSLSLASMVKDSALSYKSSMKHFERELIINAVRDTGSLDKAAMLLDVETDFLIDRFSELDISDSELVGDEL